MRRKWQDIRREPELSPAQEAQLAAEERALQDGLTLAELRAARGQTQVTLARALATAQPSVARLEARQDHYLSTLSAYIAALGGQLHLVAAFPDGEYRLQVPPVSWDDETAARAAAKSVTAD